MLSSFRRISAHLSTLAHVFGGQAKPRGGLKPDFVPAKSQEAAFPVRKTMRPTP